MTTFNELTTQDTVVSSDQFPIYSTTNGQARKVSAQALLTFMESNLDNTLAPVSLKSYLITELPAAASYPYAAVYCLNGNVGQPCVAVSNGTAWKVVALGATVS